MQARCASCSMLTGVVGRRKGLAQRRRRGGVDAAGSGAERAGAGARCGWSAQVTGARGRRRGSRRKVSVQGFGGLGSAKTHRCRSTQVLDTWGRRKLPQECQECGHARVSSALISALGLPLPSASGESCVRRMLLLGSGAATMLLARAGATTWLGACVCRVTLRGAEDARLVPGPRPLATDAAVVLLTRPRSYERLGWLHCSFA